MSKYQDLLGCVDVIMDMDKDQYTILPGWGDLPRPCVREVSLSHAHVRCDTIWAWLLLSQLRCDTAGNLYLLTAKYERLTQ